MRVTTAETSTVAPDEYPCDRWHSCDLRHLCGKRQVATANEIAHRVLERAPGTFGKLVLLSSLCRCRADAYHHPALDKVVPECLASLILQRNHEQLFSSWLELHLEEQCKEVGEYFAAPETGQRISSGARQDWREWLVPPGARAPERALFLSDLELVLSLVQD